MLVASACHEVPTSSTPELPKAAQVPVVTTATPASTILGSIAGTDSGLPETDAAVTWASGPAEPLYVGRFVATAKGQGCGWSGCEIRLRFRGTGVKARMDTGWANRFRVRIDGDKAKGALIKGKGGEDTYTLAEGLSEGVHELSIIRLTEAGFGEWHVRDIMVDGEMLARPTPRPRRIEFIGDSITCGAGNTGATAHCPLDQNTEDETLSYAALAADQLGASHTNLCYSGRGVYRDAKGFTSHPMTLLWKRTFVQRRDLLWQPGTLVPDAVVVNLGTNDTALSYEREKYVSAQASFYKVLRKAYPDAHIAYVVGTRKTTANVQQARADLQRLVTSFGADANASFFSFASAESDEHDGCAFHPGLRTHERMADAVTLHLREKLHWN